MVKQCIPSEVVQSWRVVRIDWSLRWARPGMSSFAALSMWTRDVFDESRRMSSTKGKRASVRTMRDKRIGVSVPSSSRTLKSRSDGRSLLEIGVALLRQQ